MEDSAKLAFRATNKAPLAPTESTGRGSTAKVARATMPP
jgi:hypothetical protein